MKKSILYLGTTLFLCVLCVYVRAAGSQSVNHGHAGEGISEDQRQRLGSQLIAFAKINDVNNVQRLLRAGAPLDCVDESMGNTALGWAAYYGFEAVIQALLAGGADVNAVSTQGATPLNIAIGRREAGVVRLLLEAGVHIDNQRVWDSLRGLYDVSCSTEVTEVLSVHGAMPLTRQQRRAYNASEQQKKRNLAQLRSISQDASLVRKAAIEVSLDAIPNLPWDLQRLIISMSEYEPVVRWWKQHDQKREAQSREVERPHKRRKREVS